MLATKTVATTTVAMARPLATIALSIGGAPGPGPGSTTFRAPIFGGAGSALRARRREARPTRRVAGVDDRMCRVTRAVVSIPTTTTKPNVTTAPVPRIVQSVANPGWGSASVQGRAARSET